MRECGLDALDLVETPRLHDSRAPWVDDVTDAAAWFAELVVSDEDALEDYTLMVALSLAQALAHHESGNGISNNLPDGFQRAYVRIVGHFAPIVRDHISASQVQAAACQSGVWPL